METSLTSALIIRRSPGVAVCRPEKLTHMWLWCKATEAWSRQDVAAGQGEGALLCWQTEIITKSLSCWVFPSQRDRFSFPPLLPPLFFLLPSAAHNSEHYMTAALKHWGGFREQDRTPPPSSLYVEFCTGLNCDCGRTEDASTPFLLLRQEAEWLRVFPSLFTLFWLPFIFFLSVIHNFPCGVMALIFESI